MLFAGRIFVIRRNYGIKNLIFPFEIFVIVNRPRSERGERKDQHNDNPIFHGAAPGLRNARNCRSIFTRELSSRGFAIAEARKLALANALHAEGMAIAVNPQSQSNPNEAERDILNIVIGARVPPQ
jgi:hypothetical protein